MHENIDQNHGKRQKTVDLRQKTVHNRKKAAENG